MNVRLVIDKNIHNTDMKITSLHTYLCNNRGYKNNTGETTKNFFTDDPFVWP